MADYYKGLDVTYLAPDLREGMLLAKKCPDREVFYLMLGRDTALPHFSDLYSLGRVLLEILTRCAGKRVPFTWAYDRDHSQGIIADEYSLNLLCETFAEEPDRDDEREFLAAVFRMVSTNPIERTPLHQIRECAWLNDISD